MSNRFVGNNLKECKAGDSCRQSGQVALSHQQQSIMLHQTKLFSWTLCVSFLGSLPLGTLNVSITHLFLHKGIAATLLFSAGAIGVELLLVRVAIEGMERLEKWKRFHRMFQWAALIMLVCFAVFSIVSALKMASFHTALPLFHQNYFVAGVVLSALNPLHLPFWLTWTAAFKTKGLLQTNATAYNVFVLAIGIGTAAAFSVYGWIGGLLIRLLQEKQYLLNWAVGLTLLGTALLQVAKARKSKVKPAPVAP